MIQFVTFSFPSWRSQELPGSLCFFFMCYILESFVLNFFGTFIGFLVVFLTCFSTQKSLAVFWKKGEFSGELGPYKKMLPKNRLTL